MSFACAVDYGAMKPGSLVTCRSVLARWLGGALLALAAGVAAAASPGVVARDVRLESTPEGAQAVIELSGKASHHLFTLDNPHRVVVDVRNAVLRPGVRLPQGAGPIRSIRAGAQAGSTLRLVFDLESKMPARASLTSSGAAPGYRLLVDFVAEPAATPVAVVATHAPADSGRDIVVAIDAGHGGADPGAIGHAGTREKDVVLAIARRLAARIDAEPGMRAILTRDGDYYIAHRERIRRARAGKADLFVSVHADSIPKREISGASVYVLSERGATDEAARWLAERENAADLKGGVSLDDKDDVLATVLLDLSQSAAIGSSMEAAQRVLGSLGRIAEVRKPRVQQAGFLVLKSPDIPSMLIETAYISNGGDERRLGADDHQGRLAQAIFGGIRGYFEANPPDGTSFARARRGGSVLAAAP